MLLSSWFLWCFTYCFTFSVFNIICSTFDLGLLCAPHFVFSLVLITSIQCIFIHFTVYTPETDFFFFVQLWCVCGRFKHIHTLVVCVQHTVVASLRGIYNISLEELYWFWYCILWSRQKWLLFCHSSSVFFQLLIHTYEMKHLVMQNGFSLLKKEKTASQFKLSYNLYFHVLLLKDSCPLAMFWLWSNFNLHTSCVHTNTHRNTHPQQQ